MEAGGGGEAEMKETVTGSPPTDPRELVSSDDEIDYSIEPEFYDPNLDDKDELWMHRQRKNRTSDAILSCPACFTTLCLDCQSFEDPSVSSIPFSSTHGGIESADGWPRLTDLYHTHEKYVTQYRAMFVVNCKVITDQILREAKPKWPRRKSKDRKFTANTTEGTQSDEVFRPVCCLVCSTEVGVYDKDEIYHFFNVIPSNA